MPRYGGVRASGARGHVLAVVILALTLSECGGPAAPNPQPSASPTPEVRVGFLIISGVNVVGVDQAIPLTANAYPRFPSPSRNYSPFDVSREGQWDSSDEGIATVDSAGLVTGHTVGAAQISVSYKEAAYTLPVIVTGSRTTDSLSRLVGTWAGEGTMTCQRLSGVGKNVCDFDGRGVPDRFQQAVELTLSLSRGMLTGTLRLYQEPTGPVQAALLDNGELAVGGGLRGKDHATTIVQLREWRLAVTRGGRLVGTVTTDEAFVNVYSPQLRRSRVEIKSLAHVR